MSITNSLKLNDNINNILTTYRKNTYGNDINTPGPQENKIIYNNSFNHKPIISKGGSISIFIVTFISSFTLLYILSPSFVKEDIETNDIIDKCFDKEYIKKKSLKKIIFYSLIISITPQFISLLLIK